LKLEEVLITEEIAGRSVLDFSQGSVDNKDLEEFVPL
jgi:hypothetical protein